MSRSDLSDHANVLPFPVRETRRSVDPQIWFPDAFSRYLRARFDRPEQISAAYGVRHSTAWKWWNGESAPAGHQVMRTVMGDPEALAFFIADFGRAA